MKSNSGVDILGRVNGRAQGAVVRSVHAGGVLRFGDRERQRAGDDAVHRRREVHGIGPQRRALSSLDGDLPRAVCRILGHIHGNAVRAPFSTVARKSPRPFTEPLTTPSAVNCAVYSCASPAMTLRVSPGVTATTALGPLTSVLATLPSTV